MRKLGPATVESLVLGSAADRLGCGCPARRISEHDRCACLEATQGARSCRWQVATSM